MSLVVRSFSFLCQNLDLLDFRILRILGRIVSYPVYPSILKILIQTIYASSTMAISSAVNRFVNIHAYSGVSMAAMSSGSLTPFLSSKSGTLS